MNPRLIKKHCQLDAGNGALLKIVMSEVRFTPRAYDRILKVSRTLADL